MQCWLFSIRGQIKMSHYFDIKKKSIFISIVLVKFLTIVCWIYKIPYYSGLSRPSDKGGSGHPDPEMGGGGPGLFFGPSGLILGLAPKNYLNLHIQSLEDQLLQFALASISPLRWVVCCVFTDCGSYIINHGFETDLLSQCFYLTTFVRFFLSSATFNTFDTIWNYATF